jgi:hypothetical protein
MIRQVPSLGSRRGQSRHDSQQSGRAFASPVELLGQSHNLTQRIQLGLASGSIADSHRGTSVALQVIGKVLLRKLIA